MSATHQLEFNNAMTDFKIMFPDMESEVIEAILRINKGSVESTIDALLSISQDNQNEVLMRKSGSEPEPSILKESISKDIVKNMNPNIKGPKSKWNPFLLPLDSNFLRIDQTVQFDLSDEFATMLQNEEFMNELRFNQDFLSTLEKDQHGKVQDLSFDERLKKMGKMSRKKFTQLARVFHFQRNKKPAQKPKNLQLLESDDDEPVKQHKK